MNSKTTPYDEDRNQKHIRLAEAYQKGNAEAAGKLLTDFQPLLRKLAYDPIRQTFDEDLSQQLALVFLEKTKVYDAEKLPIFALYIKQQLKWGEDRLAAEGNHVCEGRVLRCRPLPPARGQ